MRLTSQLSGKPARSAILEQGDLAVSQLLERHAMVALENTVFLALPTGRAVRTSSKSDTFPLRDARVSASGPNLLRIYVGSSRGRGNGTMNRPPRRM